MYGLGTYINWPICGGAQQIAATQNFAGLSGYMRSRGMGCAGGCSCGGTCQKGLGYFDTGWDISGWGWMEWGTVAVVAYMLMSTFQTSRRSYKRATGTVKRYRKRSAARRRAQLESELSSL